MAPSTLSHRAFTRLLRYFDTSLADNPTRILKADEEVHVLALIVLLRPDPLLTAAQYAALESLYAARFAERPWWHRLPIEVLLDITRGEPPSDFFYAQFWIGRAALRDWINEVAWFLRDHLALGPAVANMAVNIEYGQYGTWIGHLWWLIERDPTVRYMLMGTPARQRPDWYEPGLRAFFEAGEGRWRKILDESERDAIQLLYEVARDGESLVSPAAPSDGTGSGGET